MESKIKLIELNEVVLKDLLKEKGFELDFKDGLKSILGNKKMYKVLGIKYGIVYNFDSVQFGKIDELVLDFENILEARLFNEEMEIVIRINEDDIEGNILVDLGEEEHVIEENFYIRGSRYDKLKVKKYIRLDEDNQGYIFYLKPCEFLKEV